MSQTRYDTAMSFLASQLASMSTLESKSDLVIGIDFGTTFTGVAFAHTGNVTGNDVSKIAENLDVVRAWPNPSLQYAEKTPTIISYNTDPPTWGGNVKPKDEPQVSHFKLGLQPRVADHYRTGNSSSILAFLDPNWKNPVPNKKAVDFAADYLTCVHRYVKEVALPRQFGETFLRGQQISYVITVPAIWKDSAKALTRQAAERAGIPQRKLELITEPEAAALYCATICREVDLKNGDRFLVCDAGGGTVDLISYLVVSRDPFSVEECNEGSGAACGAIFLNKGFENLLRTKLGDQANTILTARRLNEAIRYFENSIKRAFNPFDNACDDEYDIPLSGARDMPGIDLEDGYLKLSKNDIHSVFQPIFDQIYQLINKQMEDVESKCHERMKTLLLVGGLGSNIYLIQYLEKKLGSRIDIKQPTSGYSAIMRGAVLHRMGFNFVKERIMRRNYGVTYIKTPFEPGVDPEHLREISISGLPACRDVMRWYAKKGEKLPNGHVVSDDFGATFTLDEYENEPLIQVPALVVCEDDDAPAYETDAVVPLCILPVDLSPLKPFKKVLGLQGYFYRVSFDLTVSFGPELVFQLVHEGRVIGSISAKYA